MNPRRLQFIVVSILILAVMAACLSSPATPSTGSTGSTATLPSQPVKSACSNDYFPDSSGTTWSYSSTGSVLGPYTDTWTISDVSDTGFSTAILYSTGLNSTIKWNCQDGNLAALDSGSDSLSMASSKFKWTTTSVTGDGYNIPNTFADGTTWSENVTANGIVVSGSKSIDSQIASAVKCSAAGTESVTVPAGTFDTVKATCTDTVTVSTLSQGTLTPASTPSTVNVTDWYAKGVGLVKTVRVSTVSGTNTVVLTQYSVK